MKKITLVLITATLSLLGWFWINQGDVNLIKKVKVNEHPSFIKNVLLYNDNYKIPFMQVHKDSTFNSITYTDSEEALHFKTDKNQKFDLNISSDSILYLTITKHFENPFNMLYYRLFGVKEVSNWANNRADGLLTYFKLFKDNTRLENTSLDSAKTHFPTRYYAYLEQSKPVREKANQMMRDNTYILGKILKNGAKNTSYPFNLISKWENDSIQYRFCFPIDKSDVIKFKNSEVKVDSLLVQPEKTVVYRGNYMYSDKGWYSLKTEVSSSTPIIEVFENNPMNGGTESEWRAYIFSTK